MKKEIPTQQWQQDILDNEGLSDWKIRNTTNNKNREGLTLKGEIICPMGDVAMFLHEVAHALKPKDKFHAESIWGAEYDRLVHKYMILKP